MKIAVFSDVHANLHALQAVWDDIQSQNPDHIYCLGDLVGYGAFANEVVAFVREQNIPTVIGNYDEGAGYNMKDCGCAYKTKAMRNFGDQSLRWTQGQLIPEHKTFLQALPLQIRARHSGRNLMFVHGSPRRINEYLFQDRPKRSFERIARLAGSDVLCFGHTHLPYQKRTAGTLFVNTGSVGKPKDGDPRAGYVILHVGLRVRVELRRVAYDVASAAEAVRRSDLPNIFADLFMSGGVLPEDWTSRSAA